MKTTTFLLTLYSCAVRLILVRADVGDASASAPADGSPRPNTCYIGTEGHTTMVTRACDEYFNDRQSLLSRFPDVVLDVCFRRQVLGSRDVEDGTWEYGCCASVDQGIQACSSFARESAGYNYSSCQEVTSHGCNAPENLPPATDDDLANAFCAYPMWTIPEVGSARNGRTARCDHAAGCPKVTVTPGCEDSYGVRGGDECRVVCADDLSGPSEVARCVGSREHSGWEIVGEALVCGPRAPRPEEAAGEASGRVEECGPVGVCGPHSICQGSCPSGKCSSVHCVCEEGYEGCSGVSCEGGCVRIGGGGGGAAEGSERLTTHTHPSECQAGDSGDYMERAGQVCTEEGLECGYGEECCCGECHDAYALRCEGGIWVGRYADACAGARMDECLADGDDSGADTEAPTAEAPPTVELSSRLTDSPEYDTPFQDESKACRHIAYSEIRYYVTAIAVLGTLSL